MKHLRSQRLGEVVALGARLRALATVIPIGREPPTEFRLWAFGVVDTTYGEFIFERADAENVMAAYAAMGNEKFFDYEHGLLYVPPGEPIPAAGWFQLELRDDGLWVTNIRWTEKAAGMIGAGEYEYFSPLFWYDDDRRIYEVVNIGLTNYPGTKSLDKLPVAASMHTVLNRAKYVRGAVSALSVSWNDLWTSVSAAVRAVYGDSTYLLELFTDYAVFEAWDSSTGQYRVFRVNYTLGANDTVQLDDQAFEARRQYETAPEGKVMNRILLALALSASATEDQALDRIQALSKSQADLLALTGATDLATALATVRAWKEGNAQAVALSARLDSLERSQTARELDDLIALGKQQRKISPSLETWARTQTPAALSAFLEHAPAVIDATSTPTEGKPDITLAAFEAMSFTDRAAIAQQSPDTYRALSAELRQKGRK